MFAALQEMVRSTSSSHKLLPGDVDGEAAVQHPQNLFESAVGREYVETKWKILWEVSWEDR